MFKNIFPDKLNRLIYKKFSTPSDLKSSPGLTKKVPWSPATEARNLDKTINAYVKQIERNFNKNNKNKIDINLNDPKTYMGLPIELENIAKLFVNARKDLEKAKKTRDRGKARIILNNARTLAFGAAGFYNSCIMEGRFSRKEYVAEAPKTKRPAQKKRPVPKMSKLKPGATEKFGASEQLDFGVLSEGYPKASPRQYAKAYAECKAALAKGKYKWVPGTKAKREVWETGTDGKLHGRTFILVADYKKNTFKFYKKRGEKVKTMPVAPAEDLAKENITKPVREITNEAVIKKIAKAVQWDSMRVGGKRVKYALYTAKELTQAGIVSAAEIGFSGAIFLVKDANQGNKNRLFGGRGIV